MELLLKMGRNVKSSKKRNGCHKQKGNEELNRIERIFRNSILKSTLYFINAIIFYFLKFENESIFFRRCPK